MKEATFTVSLELLHNLLMLPSDCEVRTLAWDEEARSYRLRVRGEALPDACLRQECDVIKTVTPHYRSVDGKAEFAGWAWTHSTTARYAEETS